MTSREQGKLTDLGEEARRMTSKKARVFAAQVAGICAAFAPGVRGSGMTKTSIPRELRRRLQVEARGRCAYCHSLRSITGARLVVDHVVAETGGWGNSAGNEQGNRYVQRGVEVG